MASRILGLTIGLAAVAALTILSAGPEVRQQITGRSGQQSYSGSIGPVSPSVIGSWQAHGAGDFVTESASPSRPLPPTPNGQDWILDLVVLWRWPGRAPPLRQGAVGDEVGGAKNVHRIAVGDRELRVQFDPEASTAHIVNGPVVQLKGANVLMLDVRDRDVRVAGTALVDPRCRSGQDPVATVIERSPVVAAFVTSKR